MNLKIIPAGKRFQVANIPSQIVPELKDYLRTSDCEVSDLSEDEVNNLTSLYVIIPDDSVESTKSYIKEFVKSRT